jgi:hypothetical protein
LRASDVDKGERARAHTLSTAKHRRFGIRTLPIDEKTYKKMKKVLLLLTIFRSGVFSDKQVSAMLKRFVESRSRMPRGDSVGIGCEILTNNQ